MRTPKRWRVGVVVLLLSLVHGPGGVGDGSAQSKPGGTLVMVHTDPGVMNPILEVGWPHFPRMSFNGLHRPGACYLLEHHGRQLDVHLSAPEERAVA
jgi:hypothetical protein